ncbi:MAG: peptidoglycan-binding protein, partial [Actinomycetota bacterium]|nr:peptidoglycan-binding protein [Actinomycetota bacterium]
MRRVAAVALSLLSLPVLDAEPASAIVGSSHVAALQVALRHQGLYGATIDGIRGPDTTRAVRRFQRRAGLTVDGVAGHRTRRALGPYGTPNLGQRLLSDGFVGWDVSQLQFLLAWHGFPSGTFDGVFGARLKDALRRFQRYARLAIDGVAGRATVAALRRSLPRSPLTVSWPLAGPVTGSFGPRGARFHAGVDIAAARGSAIGSARGGRVTFAGWSGGYGKLVLVSHGRAVWS